MRTLALFALLPLLAPPSLAQEDPPTAAGTRAATARPAPAYEWVEDWLQLPPDVPLGNTHGAMVIDESGLIYLNTDTPNAVIVVKPDGSLHSRWGKDLAGGLHGMCIVKEGGEEFLYLAHTSRAEVLKTTLTGEVIWTLDYPATAGIYANAGEFKPTGVAVAPNGDIYVADGYGKSYVHHYRKDRKYVRSFGGHGSEPGQFKTCHGIWLDQRAKTPTLVVADRENHRLQVFDLDGNHLETVEQGLRRPCNVYEHDGMLVVADLAGRITLLDERNELVAHLCDNADPALRAKNGIPRERWKVGEFIAPHSACFDSSGNLFVMDWNFQGRITKLRRMR